MNIYVSRDGDDQWSGNYGQLTAERDDGPLRSLDEAFARVEKLLSPECDIENINIILRGGMYFFNKPLQLNQQKISAGKKSSLPEVMKPFANCPSTILNEKVPCSINICPYGNEEVILSGGAIVDNWHNIRHNNTEMWVADLSGMIGNGTFRQIWVNGQRRYRVKLPKTGEYCVAEAPDAVFDPDARFDLIGSSRFRYDRNDINPDWKNLNDVEINFFTKWTSGRAKIKSVDPLSREVVLDRKSTFRLTSDAARSPSDGAPYVVENVFEALSLPGEWYFDRGEKRLYYVPQKGETPENTQVIVPRLEKLLVVKRARRDELFTLPITFKNLTFCHTDWQLPGNCFSSCQADHHVPGAIVFDSAHNCVMDHCTFSHIGSCAVELVNGSRDVAVTGCRLHDLAGGGIKILSGCNRITVSDNEIFDGGRIFHSSIGILIGKSSANIIVRNHIHRFPYTAVSLGWCWSFDDNNAFGNIIEYNHIHDIGGKLLNDMGGIYSCGVSTGSRIRFNKIHDISGRSGGTSGIYLDESSSDMLVENNLIYNTNNGIHEHCGRNNIYRYNIMAGCGNAFVFTQRDSYRWLKYPEQCVTLERNIFYGNKSFIRFQMLYSETGNRKPPKDHVEFHFDSDHNLFWNYEEPDPVIITYLRYRSGKASGEPQTLKMPALKKRGYDVHSIMADPAFVDPAKTNFSLKATSPAFGLGFRDFDDESASYFAADEKI